MSQASLIQSTLIDKAREAQRQVTICNACRYCEGYCAVFPAISRQRMFNDGDMIQLANLCHNCRGCYYACQYTEPHEFAINLPQVLAQVRQDSWQEYATPRIFAKHFHHRGSAVVILLIAAFALFMLLIQLLQPTQGQGFYGLLSHNTMVSLFIPAFTLPLLSIAISLRRYWRDIGGKSIKLQHIYGALQHAATMKNLNGGHGEGCNFENEDRFSHWRRWFHQATLYGFLLCFAATSVATIMHYFFTMPAPYSLFSLPKLLGLSGGILLCVGTAGLIQLKLQAERKLADSQVWGGEMGFILLLFFVSATGLALYALGSSAWLGLALAIHLATVLCLFLLMPYSKMVHGFYRLAALIFDEQVKQDEQVKKNEKVKQGEVRK